MSRDLLEGGFGASGCFFGECCYSSFVAVAVCCKEKNNNTDWGAEKPLWKSDWASLWMNFEEHKLIFSDHKIYLAKADYLRSFNLKKKTQRNGSLKSNRQWLFSVSENSWNLEFFKENTSSFKLPIVSSH